MSVHGYPIVSGSGGGGGGGGFPSVGDSGSLDVANGSGGWLDTGAQIVYSADSFSLKPLEGRTGEFYAWVNEIGMRKKDSGYTAEQRNYCTPSSAYSSMYAGTSALSGLCRVNAVDGSGVFNSSQVTANGTEQAIVGAYSGEEINLRVVFTDNVGTEVDSTSFVQLKNAFTFRMKNVIKFLVLENSTEIRHGTATYHFDENTAVFNKTLQVAPAVLPAEAPTLGQVQALIAAIPAGSAFETYTMGRYSLGGIAASTGVGVPMTGDGTINAPKGFSPIQTFSASTSQRVKGHHVCNYGSSIGIEIELRFTATIPAGGLSPTAGTLAGSTLFNTTINGAGNKFEITSNTTIPAGSYVWLRVIDNTNSFAQTVVSATIKAS